MIGALLEGDTAAAAREVGGEVGSWLVRNPDHLLQVGRIAGVAQSLATGRVDPGPGRVVVLVEDDGRRRAIGSIGFHRPPDDQGRLVIGSSIAPAYRGRGLVGEALRALIDWTARNRGIDAFLLHVSASAEAWDQEAPELPIEDLGGTCMADVAPADGGHARVADLVILRDRHDLCRE